jgi:hypothetical protein
METMDHDLKKPGRHQPRARQAAYPIMVLAVLCVVLVGIAPACAAEEITPGAKAAPPLTHASTLARTRPHAGDPAAAFAKRLELDPRQEAQVRRLLAMRHDEIRRVWTDPGIAADDRVGAVKAINDNTRSQIRALLTEEQRKKYFQPRPAESAATDPKPSVGDWLNATRPHQLEASPSN